MTQYRWLQNGSEVVTTSNNSLTTNVPVIPDALVTTQVAFQTEVDGNPTNTAFVHVYPAIKGTLNATNEGIVNTSTVDLTSGAETSTQFSYDVNPNTGNWRSLASGFPDTGSWDVQAYITDPVAQTLELVGTVNVVGTRSILALPSNVTYVKGKGAIWVLWPVTGPEPTYNTKIVIQKFSDRWVGDGPPLAEFSTITSGWNLTVFRSLYLDGIIYLPDAALKFDTATSQFSEFLVSTYTNFVVMQDGVLFAIAQDASTNIPILNASMPEWALQYGGPSHVPLEPVLTEIPWYRGRIMVSHVTSPTSWSEFWTQSGVPEVYYSGGGDKAFSYWSRESDGNPSQGYRELKVCNSHKLRLSPAQTFNGIYQYPIIISKRNDAPWSYSPTRGCDGIDPAGDSGRSWYDTTTHWVYYQEMAPSLLRDITVYVTQGGTIHTEEYTATVENSSTPYTQGDYSRIYWYPAFSTWGEVYNNTSGMGKAVVTTPHFEMGGIWWGEPQGGFRPTLYGNFYQVSSSLVNDTGAYVWPYGMNGPNIHLEPLPFGSSGEGGYVPYAGFDIYDGTVGVDRAYPPPASNFNPTTTTTLFGLPVGWDDTELTFDTVDFINPDFSVKFGDSIIATVNMAGTKLLVLVDTEDFDRIPKVSFNGIVNGVPKVISCKPYSDGPVYSNQVTIIYFVAELGGSPSAGHVILQFGGDSDISYLQSWNTPPISSNNAIFVSDILDIDNNIVGFDTRLQGQPFDTNSGSAIPSYLCTRTYSWYYKYLPTDSWTLIGSGETASYTTANTSGYIKVVFGSNLTPRTQYIPMSWEFNGFNINSLIPIYADALAGEFTLTGDNRVTFTADIKFGEPTDYLWEGRAISSGLWETIGDNVGNFYSTPNIDPPPSGYDGIRVTVSDGIGGLLFSPEWWL